MAATKRRRAGDEHNATVASTEEAHTTAATAASDDDDDDDDDELDQAILEELHAKGGVPALTNSRRIPHAAPPSKSPSRSGGEAAPAKARARRDTVKKGDFTIAVLPRVKSRYEAGGATASAAAFVSRINAKHKRKLVE